MSPGDEARPGKPPAGVWLAAAATVAVHLATAGNYGVFRDEFYYLACADHLAWGYVDHPPLSIALLAVVRLLLGASVWALRLVPAILGGCLVVLAARLAWRLGGGRFAQTFAALAAAVAPQYLGIFGYYSMNALDLVFWSALALLVLRLEQTGERRLWLPLGALLGLGLLNKLSILFFLAGLAAALPWSPLRRHLRHREPWLGALLAAALFVPHILWQVANDWPTREFVRNAQAEKIAALSPWRFFLAQFLEIHPLNALVWLGGLAWLCSRRGRRFRTVGIVFLAAFAVMVFQRSKPYYLGPAFPPLLAAGAVAIEPWLASRRVLRGALLTLWAAGGAALAPFVVPLLPVERFVAYQQALGIEPGTDERHEMGPLPQFFADRFGWREMAAEVARVYHSLPASERARTLIATGNYGEAGAINHFGPALGLPRAVSQHNSFYLWGPGDVAGVTTVITVGMSADGPTQVLASCEPAGRVEAPYAMPYETRHPILVCRDWTLDPLEAWRRGKHYE
jgi:4-amino-4-deoxy-L-arabinose transferase-like glycosyltransferase